MRQELILGGSRTREPSFTKTKLCCEIIPPCVGFGEKCGADVSSSDQGSKCGNGLRCTLLRCSLLGHELPPIRHIPFLLSRILCIRESKIQRESIVIVRKFELEILTNLHVLDLPESEKHNFGIMSVCLRVCKHDYSKTIRATGMKFGMWSLNIICRFLSNCGQNPSTGSLSVCPKSCEHYNSKT
ncbi:hypothetical protein AVEN_171713-1 [Araneus ventricosus]|uniref:Uncharacterized protein n=1 Tax=Araneus ventricosus TaxID=182803 RepID=A0A4Y2M283_ARAVE|nr:hypothetical protein AVEN_171713-1 [Araneus ventricosus]